MTGFFDGFFSLRPGSDPGALLMVSLAYGQGGGGSRGSDERDASSHQPFFKMFLMHAIFP